MKSVQIWSCFWSVFSRIQSEYEKRRTRKNSVFGHFSRCAHYSSNPNKKMTVITKRSRRQTYSFKQIMSKEKITLEENESFKWWRYSSSFAYLFSNALGSRNIPEYVTNDPVPGNINNSIIKLIVKWRKHPNKLTIGAVCK